jgi:uncharacterized protein (TIGR00730 family)
MKRTIQGKKCLKKTSRHINLDFKQRGAASIRKQRQFQEKFGYLHSPTFRSNEADFLSETENFFTGLYRALRMFYEYMRGFYAFQKTKNCVTIFGSARFPKNHPYYQLARETGKLLAATKFTVMTGGGPGIMEAASRGAKEGGGLSLCCNIILPAAGEPPNAYADKRIHMHYFFIRKVFLTKYSVAFIIMPGGFGTLDEMFEMMTLIQTKKMKNFPLVLMGKSFWQPLINFMRSTLLEEGTIAAKDIDNLLLTDSPEEAVDYIYQHLALCNKVEAKES